MKGALAACLAFAVWSGPLFAANPSSADLTQSVSEILARFPAESPAKMDALCAELLKMGPEALADVSGRVLPPAAGDDARARFALNGLAVYVARPGAEDERALFARALLDALAKTADRDVAAFFLSQVRLVGKEEAVRPLERYLVDETLAGPAAAALVAIGGPESAKALVQALDQAPRDARLALLLSLGEARSREAVAWILPFADGSDGLRQAALFALANIGDPAAGPVLSRSLLTASFRERSQAPSLYLLYARRLAESGRTTEALEAARAVLQNYQAPGELQHASAALALVVSTLGAQGLPDLLAAVESSDRSFRGAALTQAERIPGTEATLRWVEKAGSSSPDTRADIIAMLGRRGDAAALPFVRGSLRGEEKAVRLAAISAAPLLGGEAVLPDLLALLGSADADESAALKAALLGYRGVLVVPAVARLIDATPLPSKAILIDILGEKGARDEIERVYRLAEDPDPAIREASLRALGNLAGDADLPLLVAMLEKADASDDIVRLREAVAAAILKGPDPQERADQLLKLLENAGPTRRIAILRVLPRVGGTRPLQAAAAESASPDAEVQSAAIGALSRWPDPEATVELLRIATATPSPEHFRVAIQGYVRLVGRSIAAGQEKLGPLAKLLEARGEDADRKALLSGIAAIREPESLRLLARHLDDPGLGDAAAAGLLDLASRQSPEEFWLSGHEAISVLRRVEASQTDPATRERSGQIILERLRQGGFSPLFDGRSLDGWRGLATDPKRRAKVTPRELVSRQAAADLATRAHWKAVDGVLVFDGKGEGLATTGTYRDFELLADWKIEKGGAGGLHFRGSPRVQIGDAEKHPAGSGGLVSGEKGRSQPIEKADRLAGEWNTFRILTMGERVTIYLNDKRVVDNKVLANDLERDQPTDSSGPIGLQALGKPLWFRNIFVRAIPPDTAVPGMTAAEASEGFVPLFNGRDLEGWTGQASGYVAEDGKIVVHPERGGGNLYTTREYTDFVLRFEFKLTPAANNGLGIRAPLEGDAAYTGMELQILEDGSPVYWGLQPYQHHGSIYGVVPARSGHLRPIGEWNREEVTVKGRRVSVVVNGEIVVDADVGEASASGTVDGKDHPGLERASGHVGFLGHGSIVEFRKIQIKELR